MTKEEAYHYIDNLKWLKGYDNTVIGGKTVGEILDEINALLKEQTWRKFEFREPDADEKESHPEWVKVLIGGPDDGDGILVSNGKYVWEDEFHVDDTCYLDSDADLEECWWMPMPEPPKEGDGE